MKKEDLINDSQPGPVRYAYPVNVNYTLENSGVWQELNDGSKIWRLKVKLPGALSKCWMQAIRQFMGVRYTFRQEKKLRFLLEIYRMECIK
jgi:hypothetical protein